MNDLHTLISTLNHRTLPACTNHSNAHTASPTCLLLSYVHRKLCNYHSALHYAIQSGLTHPMSMVILIEACVHTHRYVCGMYYVRRYVDVMDGCADSTVLQYCMALAMACNDRVLIGRTMRVMRGTDREMYGRMCRRAGTHRRTGMPDNMSVSTGTSMHSSTSMHSNTTVHDSTSKCTSLPMHSSLPMHDSTSTYSSTTVYSSTSTHDNQPSHFVVTVIDASYDDINDLHDLLTRTGSTILIDRNVLLSRTAHCTAMPCTTASQYVNANHYVIHREYYLDMACTLLLDRQYVHAIAILRMVYHVSTNVLVHMACTEQTAMLMRMLRCVRCTALARRLCRVVERVIDKQTMRRYGIVQALGVDRACVMVHDGYDRVKEWAVDCHGCAECGDEVAYMIRLLDECM